MLKKLNRQEASTKTPGQNSGNISTTACRTCQNANETAEGTFSAVYLGLVTLSHIAYVALFVDPCYWQKKRGKKPKTKQKENTSVSAENYRLKKLFLEESECNKREHILLKGKISPFYRSDN